MTTIDALKDAILFECQIAIHLHSKLEGEAFAYRPSEGQRSTLELLRYLAACGIGSMRAMVEGDWTGYTEATERVHGMEAAAFPAAMARQKEEMARVLDGLSDQDLHEKEATLPWGETVSLGRALMETTLKWLAAYRMQLFLYAKAAGRDDIGTANCWAGVDWKGDETS